jgi:hypothetical protein
MTSFEASPGREGALGLPSVEPDSSRAGSPLDRVRSALAPAAKHDLAGVLQGAYVRAQVTLAAFDDPAAGAELAALEFASDAVVALATEGELTSEDIQAAAVSLAESLRRDLPGMRYRLFTAASQNPRLLELPPLPAAGIQLRFLLDLGQFQIVSLWRRNVTGQAECVLHLGDGDVGRRMRAEARSVLRGRSGLRVVGRASLRSAPIVRYGQRVGAIVAQSGDSDRERSSAFLSSAAQAVTPVLEREVLLERSRTRERALVASGERKLMRLGFDLHDGPIQDVLALAAEV